MKAFSMDPEREEKILAELAREWATERRRQPLRRITWFDTFDWRLHGAGLRLWSEQVGRGKPHLHLGGDGADDSLREGRREGWTEGEPPDFVPASLQSIVGVRRPLPLVSVRLEVEVVRLLDARAKTVVRLFLERVKDASPDWAGGAEGPVLVRVEPLKGYEDVGATVEERLEAHGLEAAPGGFLPLALRAVGREVGDYSSKLNIHLEPGMRADSALRRILEHLRVAVVRNEDGTRRDLDPEFLHDFRVAVRRTRSVLSLVRGVLPPRQIQRLQGELKWLGGRTGPTRDLDVYLLKMGDYREALPSAVRRDLEPLEGFLRRHQRQEQRRLVRSLDSQRYRTLLELWRRLVEGEVAHQEGEDEGDGGEGETPNAARPVRLVAEERIAKALHKVLKKGGKIERQTPAAALHRLRIHCKKLRYLLEIFAGAFDAERIQPPVRALKKLQDTLGDFNDFEVQQETLRSFAHQLVAEDRSGDPEKDVDTLLAMGRLQGHLAARQARARKKFHRRFDKFAAPKVQQHFEAMLASEGAIAAGGEA